jgi:hypothetical protein
MVVLPALATSHCIATAMAFKTDTPLWAAPPWLQAFDTNGA